MNRNKRIKNRKQEKQINVPTYLLPGANELSGDLEVNGMNKNNKKENNKKEY